MDKARTQQKAEPGTAQLETIELGRASEETRGCLGVVNDFICFMPLDGLNPD